MAKNAARKNGHRVCREGSFIAVDYLVNAANDLYNTVSANEELTGVEAAQVAARGCETLRRVQDDQVFRRSVLALCQARSEHAEEFQATLDTASTWEEFDRFLVQERAVLSTAGLEPGLIEELIVQGRELVGRVRQWQGNAQQVFAMIAQLRDQACGLAARLRETEHTSQTLDEAAASTQRLVAELRQTNEERLAANSALVSARQAVQKVNAELDAAKQTIQDLTEQLADTGPLGRLRGRGRIFWRLTYGVGGLVVVAANAAATPLIGLPIASASGAIGATLVSIAIVNR